MSTNTATDDKVWYNRFYREPIDRQLVLRDEIIERYRTLPHPELFHLERWHQLVGDVRGKKLLYIGCGVEASVVLLGLRGATVWAFDLASEALRHQREMARANGTGAQTRFVAGSCGRLPFADGAFDLVIGIGILHHLQDDLETPCSEIARVLKPDGCAVFEEPIMRSSFLKRLRTYVPVPPPCDASPRCQPLEGNALDCFARHFKTKTYSFGFLSRFERVILGGVPLEFAAWWRRGTVYCLHYIDFLLFNIPGFDHFAGVAVWRFSRRSSRPETA